MEIRLLLIAAGTAVTVSGVLMHSYARHRFRSSVAPGLWPRVRPSEWRTRREWFTTEHGYTLSRRGGLMISAGGFIALIGSLL